MRKKAGVEKIPVRPGFRLHNHMFVSELMEDFAGFDDARINDLVMNIETIPAGLDETVVTQKGEMLGKIGFGKSRDTEQCFYWSLPFLQDVEDLESLGVGEDLINMGVSQVGFLWQW